MIIRNPDEKIRRLERLVESGDQLAILALAKEKLRIGEHPEDIFLRLPLDETTDPFILSEIISLLAARKVTTSLGYYGRPPIFHIAGADCCAAHRTPNSMLGGKFGPWLSEDYISRLIYNTPLCKEISATSWHEFPKNLWLLANAVCAKSRIPYIRKNPESDWIFSGVEDLLSGLEYRYDDPDYSHVELVTEDQVDNDLLIPGRNLSWKRESNYIVVVPVEYISFTNGNIWNMRHAAALTDLINTGQRPVFDTPSARLYRITKSVQNSTVKSYKLGELEYNHGMERPWKKDDIGKFWIQLLDGNHRTLAAIASGEVEIPVIVGQNYREDVKQDEWI